MLKTGNDVEVVITEELARRVIILAPGFRHNLFTRNFLGDNADRNLKAQFEDQLKELKGEVETMQEGASASSRVLEIFTASSHFHSPQGTSFDTPGLGWERK